MLPLYYIDGLVNTIIAPLVSAVSVFMPSKFSSSNFWNWIEENHYTWFSVVPTLISALIHNSYLSKKNEEKIFDHIRFGRSASAPLDPGIQQQFDSKFVIRIIATMRLTETSSPIFPTPLPSRKSKYGSHGIAWGNEIRIVDEKYQILPPGKEGEIAVRGDNVMKGYNKNVETAVETIKMAG